MTRRKFDGHSQWRFHYGCRLVRYTVVVGRKGRNSASRRRQCRTMIAPRSAVIKGTGCGKAYLCMCAAIQERQPLVFT